MSQPPPGLVEAKPKTWGCVPGCGKSSAAAKTAHAAQSTTAGFSINCGNCAQAQSVQNCLTAFVCDSCHRVNRIVIEDPGTRRVSIVPKNSPDEFQLVRTSSSTFTPESAELDKSQLKPHNDMLVPQCTVCMDGPGDMVLLPCSHGAICEACAQHISRNLSVGGAHCPKCRVDIHQLVRVCELHAQAARGVPVLVPDHLRRNAPPKVPPPAGQNKAKQQS